MRNMNLTSKNAEAYSYKVSKGFIATINYLYFYWKNKPLLRY